jgi:hypothetical protein
MTSTLLFLALPFIANPFAYTHFGHPYESRPPLSARQRRRTRPYPTDRRQAYCSGGPARAIAPDCGPAVVRGGRGRETRPHQPPPVDLGRRSGQDHAGIGAGTPAQTGPANDAMTMRYAASGSARAFSWPKPPASIPAVSRIPRPISASLPCLAPGIRSSGPLSWPAVVKARSSAYGQTIRPAPRRYGISLGEL